MTTTTSSRAPRRCTARTALRRSTSLAGTSTKGSALPRLPATPGRISRHLRRLRHAPLRQRRLAATQPKTGTIATSTNPLEIGSDHIYAQFFAGLIDEIRDLQHTALPPHRFRPTWRLRSAPARPRTRSAVGAGNADGDRSQLEPGRPLLGRATDDVGCHRLPDRALPGRRLQQLHPDRRPTGTGLTYTDTASAPAPATATECAPSTPPATSAPTATAAQRPPKHRRTRLRRRRQGR